MFFFSQWQIRWLCLTSGLWHYGGEAGRKTCVVHQYWICIYIFKNWVREACTLLLCPPPSRVCFQHLWQCCFGSLSVLCWIFGSYSIKWLNIWLWSFHLLTLDLQDSIIKWLGMQVQVSIIGVVIFTKTVCRLSILGMRMYAPNDHSSKNQYDCHNNNARNSNASNGSNSTSSCNWICMHNWEKVQ